MAIKEEFQFLSDNKKTKIHAVRWIPENGDIKAVFQISHGMLEYIERYDDFADFLTKHGFLVVGHDHLGHGGSVTTKKEWGFIDEKNGSDKMVADMHTLRTMTQSQYPELPYFMLGHSMGSYLLRKYLTIHGKNLTGAIVMGTGTMPPAMMHLGKGICRTLAFLHSWKYRSKLVKNMSFAGAYQRYSVDGSVPDNSWLTKDVDIVNHFYSEPRCTYMFTINGYYSLMDTVLYDTKMEYVKRIPKDLPIFMVSGEDDPVGDMGKGVKKVYSQLKQAGIKDVTCKLYPNDRHEILNETDRDKVYRRILKWTLSHMD